MLSERIKSQIYRNFAFEPTFGQKKVIEMLSIYFTESETERIFILDGHAGTGKTTLIGAIVNTLKELKIKTILLAPTGRAAKVMSRYSGVEANTIHKRIYRQKSSTDPDSRFTLDFNKESDAVFIVDEASMLANFSPDGSQFGSGDLLDDLISYIRSGKRCRLILVGDSAQLPPVGLENSPALDPNHMRIYGEIDHLSLDEVMRQGEESGILFNATLVRCMLEAGIIDAPLFDLSFEDVEQVEGGEILERLQDAYHRYGMEETLVITRSNKRANRFNEAVRRNVLYAEEEIGTGDMLMIVKNNYHFTERMEDCKVNFIANGDTALLSRIRRFEDFYGFRFADAELTFPDYDNLELSCKILLNTLESESPSLTRDESNRLYHEVSADYADIASKAKRFKQVKENPHFNAMQIKFAYAVTCHKAQGGQWRCIFIDKMLFGEEEMSRSLMQWLYTAITRATEKLYFINFDERFFDTK